DLRAHGPRDRDEPASHGAAQVGRPPQIRPRQDHDGGRSRRRQGFRPLSRRRRPRHSVPHASGHPPHQGLILHPWHLARPLRPLSRGRRRLRRHPAPPPPHFRAPHQPPPPPHPP